MSADSGRDADRIMKLDPMQEESWVDRLYDERDSFGMASLWTCMIVMLYWFTINAFSEWVLETAVILALLCMAQGLCVLTVLSVEMAYMRQEKCLWKESSLLR